MSNLHLLNEAFTELERRADAVTATRSAEPPSIQRRRRAPTAVQLGAVAAAVVVVSGIAVGVSVLGPGENGGTSSGAPPGQTTSSTAPGASRLPRTHEELMDRFQAILGDLATIAVAQTGPGDAVVELPPSPGATAPPPDPDTPNDVGLSIEGVLTSNDKTGGFQLTVHPKTDSNPAHCPEGDRTCEERTLPDGSLLIRDDSPLEVPGGRTYGVDLQRANGVFIGIHLSNNANPKGDSPQLSDTPPLTLDQLTAIVTSGQWLS